MKLTATVSDTTQTTMTIAGSTSTINQTTSPGYSGIVTDVELTSSADTSVSVVIADDTGIFFTVGSADYTTLTRFKVDNSALARNSVQGQLKVTATGIGSGTFTVNLWLSPHARIRR